MRTSISRTSQDYQEFQALVFGRSLDIVAVTETWLRSDIHDNEILPGNRCTIFRRDRADGRRGGGVLLAVKSNILSFRRREIEPVDAEILACELLPSNARKLTLCVCYRPPDFINFNDSFALLLAQLHTDGSDRSRSYFIGDFNYPHINWNTTTDLHDSGIAADFCHLINSYFLTQLVDEPTRYTDNTQNSSSENISNTSILDLILCECPDDVSELIVAHDILDSDHLVINFYIATKVRRLRQTRRVTYNFKNANFDGMRQVFRGITWDDVFLDNDDINNSLEKWQKTFYSIVDQFAMKKRVNNVNRPPWVDKEIVSLLRKKNTLRRKAKSRDTDYQWSRFRRIRAEIKKLIKYKKKLYISNLGLSLRTNPKRFWSYYKAINKSSRIPNVVSYGDVTATDSRSKADLFNTYFHSVFSPLDDLDDTSSLPKLNYNLTSPCLSNIVLQREDVLKALQSLDIHKASCGIPSRLLKECADTIATPLTRLFNKSLSMGEFPTQWKDANLVPIHKASRKAVVANYRGISLLDQLSKLLERGVFGETFSFISHNLTNWQHGFFPGRSSVTQLIQVVHLLAQALDNKQQVDLVYLDFSKAFDRVPHSKLLYKLNVMGIRDPLLSWFRSYLSQRRHRVVLDGFSSEWLPVTSGVPQGSVLGPLLFLIYINDMADAITQGSQLPLFADDSKCFQVIFSNTDQDNLQEDLNALYNWSITWGMEFNVDKCKVLRVVRTRTIYDRQYYLGSKQLSVVQSEKDLGVWLTTTLNWNTHTDHVVAKAQRMLGLLYRTSRDIDDYTVKRLLYSTWVRSTLEYASPVWSPYKKRNMNKIEQVQRRASRLILGHEVDYKTRLEQLQLLPLYMRREITDLVFLFKTIHGLVDMPCAGFISWRSTGRCLRNIDDLTLTVPYARTDVFKFSYFVRVTKLWNSLPYSIRAINTLSFFKMQISQHYFKLFPVTFNP